MNPCARFLKGEEPRNVIRATASRLQAIPASLGSAASQLPAPKKWSAKQVLCHMADTEMMFALRLGQALSSAKTPAYSAEAALELFTAVRAWNCLTIGVVEGGIGLSQSSVS